MPLPWETFQEEPAEPKPWDIFAAPEIVPDIVAEEVPAPAPATALPADVAAYGEAVSVKPATRFLADLRGEKTEITRGEELPVLTPSGVALKGPEDIRRAKAREAEDTWAEVMGKSVVQGGLIVPTTIGAASRFLNDLLGLDFTGIGPDIPDLYGLAQEADKFWQPEIGDNSVKKYAAQSARVMTEMGTAALLTGGSGMLPALSGSAGLQKYAEGRIEGADFWKAAYAGSTQAAIEYSTEKLPISILLKPGLSFGRRLFLGMITDVPGELMATAGEMALVDTQILGKRYSIEEYVSALKDTAIVAAGVTGGMTVATHPMVQKVEEFEKEVKSDPETFEAKFEDMLNKQAGVKGERPSPEQLEEMRVKDVQAAVDTFKDMGMDEETATTEATKIAKKLAALREVLYQEELPEAERLEPEIAISEDISKQLMATGRFTQEQADLQAEALYGSFFATMAERAGVDAEALFESYGLTIARTRTREAALEPIRVDEGGIAAVTDSQRRSLQGVRDAVEAGEAGRRVFTEAELGGPPTVTGLASSFPDYFKNKGYTKKETLKALDLVLAGEKLGARQQRIVDDLNAGYRQQAAEELREFRAREAARFEPGAPIAAQEEEVFYTTDEELAARDPEHWTTDFDDPRILFQTDETGEIVTETSAFKAWFGDSKVVDEQGAPLTVFHGTTFDIEQFSKTRGNVENDLGVGFYFSNSEVDTAENYAGEGPDLTGRIDLRTEQLEQEVDTFDNVQDLIDEFGVTKEEAVEILDSNIDVMSEVARRVARRELSGGAPNTIPVYLAIKNPVVLGSPNETFLGGIEFDEETGEESGEGLKLHEAVINVALDFEDGDGQKVWNDIVELVLDEVPASQIAEAVKQSDGAVNMTDNEGKLVSGEYIRRIFEFMGFDGIIDNTVNFKFGSDREFGQPMAGVDEDTVHYIAFEPTQIKSIFAQRFDPTDPRILAQKQKGRILFGPEGVDIELLKDADPSTFLHETGHFYLKVLGDLAKLDTATQELKDDTQIVADWLGARSITFLSREQQEKWARGFEAYLREGKAPSSKLRKAFAQFKEWLTEVYKRAQRLNVKLTPEVRGVMDRMIASQEDISLVEAEIDETVIDLVAEGKDIEKITQAEIKKHLTPAAKKTVKGLILESAGKRKSHQYIREDKALFASWKKAEQSARKAFKAGREAEAAVQKEKMRGIITKANEKVEKIQTEKQKMAKRRKTINTIKNYLGLTDAQMKGLTARRSFANMTDYEFKRFKDDLLIRAEEIYETSTAKARVMGIIEDKRLERVENYQKAYKLPPISKMSSKQLNDFADLLEPFEDGDVFLTPRQLETVDRTDLKGIKTWREAKAALAKEAGVDIEDLAAIKVAWTDKFKWDNALAESNPFYKLIVTEINKKLLEAEARVHEVEDKIFELAKKSEKSRGGTFWEKVGRKFIPQDEQVMGYLEASKEDKASVAKEMTPEQLDLAHYMQQYFGDALDYLIKIQALEKGRENYFVHMRRSFLETLKDDGVIKAVMSVFENYQLEEMVFNILDGDTGNILPLEKFFQFSLRRTGTLTPTQNVVKAFLAYSKTFEKKVTLDETIPKLDIYAQSLTPRRYTPRGLETDRSIKKFVNQYVNNKKGRHIDLGFVKQGDKVDLSIRGLRTFVTILDLGLSIPVGIASFVGEQAANFTMLGERAYARGAARARTKKGKAILKKYEAFVGRSVWEEFTQPGKEIGERVMEGMFGFFHQATVTANRGFLLATLSKAEYDSGIINEERLAQIRIEMGRMRAIPGAKSLVGSTAPGGAAVQYKGWAVPIMRTVSKDFTTLASDLRKKPLGEALTGREARELFRAVRMTMIVLLVLGLGDKEDKSFIGQLAYKTRREALTVLQAISPDMWLSTPRLIGFASQLGKNLKSLVLLEEYKTKPGLKGVGGLKRQFKPSVVRQLTPEEKKKGKLKF